MLTKTIVDNNNSQINAKFNDQIIHFVGCFDKRLYNDNFFLNKIFKIILIYSVLAPIFCLILFNLVLIVKDSCFNRF